MQRAPVPARPLEGVPAREGPPVQVPDQRPGRRLHQQAALREDRRRLKEDLRNLMSECQTSYKPTYLVGEDILSPVS